MSQKDRAPHPPKGESRRLLAIVASRADHPKAKLRLKKAQPTTKAKGQT